MDDENEAESALWIRGSAGDAAAFGAVFELHKDRVFRHAYRLLRDRYDAEDVSGVAFLELWRRRASVRVVDGSVLPWLLVTVAKAASNQRRTSERYRRLLAAIPRSELIPSAEEQALSRVVPLGDDVHEALRLVNSTNRGLLVLVIIEGYPTEQAAELLGLSAGAARTRLSRLRVRLRDALVAPIPAIPTVASNPTQGG